MTKLREAARQVLKSLEQRDGCLSPHAVIEASRSEDNPLHEYIPWDVENALKKVQLQAARNLIRSYTVQIVYGSRIIARPIYVRNPNKQHHEVGYRTLTAVSRSKPQIRSAFLLAFHTARSHLERSLSIAVEGKFETDASKINQALDILDTINGT